MKTLKPIATDFHGFARISLFLLFLTAVGMAQTKQTADVIYVNGNIYVGSTRAQALG